MRAGVRAVLAAALALGLGLSAPARAQEGPASDLLRATFPELHDAIWEVPAADNLAKQTVTAIFATAIEMSAAEVGSSALERAFGISLRKVLEEAAASPVATARMAFDEFGTGLAEDAAVSAAAALSADLLLKLPLFDDLTPAYRNILGALFRAVLEEGYGLAKGLTGGPAALSEAVISGLIDRALDVYAIARESRAVADAQRGAFVANAQSVEAAAEVGMLGTERSGRIAMETVRQAQDTLAEMVGERDAEAVRNILNMGFIALLAQKRGDLPRARSLADQMLALADKPEGIGAYALVVRPFELLLTLNREGFRDAPSEAAFVMVSTTSLRRLYEAGGAEAVAPVAEPSPPPPAPPPPAPPPPAPPPVVSEGWGPDVVYPSDPGYLPCQGRETLPDCLRALGFSEQAAAFSQALVGDYSGMGRAVVFRELGAVDLAEAEIIGASLFPVPVLLNGTPDFFAVDSTIDPAAVFFDDASQAMLRRYPGASSRDPAVVAHRLLEDGTQRFVLAETMTDQCRACDIIGTAVTFLDVGAATDGQVVRIPAGLHLTGPGFSDRIGARDLAARPDLLQLRLNLLGYQAGEMDGIAGPATRNALMEFQVRHCLPPTGEPDAATTAALAEASGFDAPCAGAVLPAGLTANAPLRAGIYVDDPALCQLEAVDANEAFFRQITLSSNGGVMWGYEDGCTTDRTDIRDGATLFRGMCQVGVESFTGSWTFDLQSSEAFRYSPVEGEPPRDFQRCADDSRLALARFAPVAAPEAVAPASPAPASDLRLEDGIYVTDPAICGNLAGADSFRNVRVLSEGAADLGVGDFCGFGEPTPSGDALEYAAHCPFSEVDYVATWRWRPTSATSFVEERGLFPDAPETPWGLEFRRCEAAGGEAAPILESADLFNLFDALLAGSCAASKVCKLEGVDGTYALRTLAPAELDLAAMANGFLMVYEQGGGQGEPALAGDILFAARDLIYMIRRAGCTGGGCATAVMIVHSDRLGSPPGASGDMGYALEMAPGWVP